MGWHGIGELQPPGHGPTFPEFCAGGYLNVYLPEGLWGMDLE